MNFDIVETLRIFNRQGVANDTFVLTVLKRRENRYMVIYGHFDGRALDDDNTLPSNVRVHISHALKYNSEDAPVRFPNGQPNLNIFDVVTKQTPLNAIQFEPHYYITLDELANYIGVSYGRLNRNTWCHLDIDKDEQGDDLILEYRMANFKDVPIVDNINKL